MRGASSDGIIRAEKPREPLEDDAATFPPSSTKGGSSPSSLWQQRPRMWPISSCRALPTWPLPSCGFFCQEKSGKRRVCRRSDERVIGMQRAKEAHQGGLARPGGHAVAGCYGDVSRRWVGAGQLDRSKDTLLAVTIGCTDDICLY